MAKAKAITIERTEQLKRFNNQFNIYSNGLDNNLPDRNEEIIDSSVTAWRCANLTSEYILGQGFENANETIVNNEGDTLFDVSESICKDLGYHRGSFIHLNIGVSQNGSVYIDSIKHIPYSHGRIGKKDDSKHYSKIHINENWLTAKKDSIHVIDVFNLNSQVVASQVQNAKGFTKYKGQILFLTLDKDRIYPRSPLKPVENDAITQSAISKLSRTVMSSGHFGSKVIITDELIDGDLDPEDEEDAKEIFKQKKEVETFQENLGKTKGVDEVDSIIHVQIKKPIEGRIKDSIHIETINSNIDTKMIEADRKNVKENICEAWKTASMLINPTSGVFGNSGEAYKQLKLFFQESVEAPQRRFVQTMRMLMKNFREPIDINHVKKIENDN